MADLEETSMVKSTISCVGHKHGHSLKIDTTLKLKPEWVGFELMKIRGQVSDVGPYLYRRGAISVLSGCITTVSPMKNQAGWDLVLGMVDPRCVSNYCVPFMAPTMMSRYEGIHQIGTSTVVKPNSQVCVNFSKSANPMVLHLSGLVIVHGQDVEQSDTIQVVQYEMRDWTEQSGKAGPSAASMDCGVPWALKASEVHPPHWRRCGNLILLGGELQEAIYGPVAQRVGCLPEGCRPRREIRGLTYLLREDSDNLEKPLVEHMVALTVRPDGTISVQGGKQQMVDSKGLMRLVQQKKKGRMSLEGVRFSLVDGTAIEVSQKIVAEVVSHKQNVGGSSASAALPSTSGNRAKLGYLMSDGSTQASTATCICENDVVLLEGHLIWPSTRMPHVKQSLATLPKGCWPHRREIFFTRGCSDTEERRRVDIDIFGRIFCPEGMQDCRVELSGIIFVAAKLKSDLKPSHEDWDELKLHYQQSSEASVLSTSFDGHELLEAFCRRCNFYEWQMVQFDMRREVLFELQMPLGSQVHPRGSKKDPFNLGDAFFKSIWQRYSPRLKERGITHAHTLLHFTELMFEQIATEVGMTSEETDYILAKRRTCRRTWESQRKPGISFTYLQDLASDIVDQMFSHWDFKAQIEGGLRNDFKVPVSIEHLFPRRYSNTNDRLIKRNVPAEDMPKFEEIRQFFYLYETTGSNMTHCSLMGSSDVFTTTGKWYFPDTPEVQKQLFENIAWLFPLKMYLYISEKQTQRFPFIEDLDIQAVMNYREWPLGETPTPPDDLIMDKPIRRTETNSVTGRSVDVVEGDPGEFMRKRASAIHLIYPHLESLECLVYTASGFNKGKEMLKSSFHVVWPQLIVDPDRAPVIRHVTLGIFHQETKKPGSFLRGLQDRLLEIHPSNQFELVFDQTTIHARNGLRLPFCDKASMTISDPEEKRKVQAGEMSKSKAFKKRVREDRPSRALGKIVFQFAKDEVTGQDVLAEAKWVADVKSHSIADWIGMGTCRRDPQNFPELTPWQIGPDVMRMLPKDQHVYFSEGFDDGEGGHWVTHKPFPNIRRFSLGTLDFRRMFSEAIAEEQNALDEENKDELLKCTIGTWVSVNATQAIWIAHLANQCPFKSLPCLTAAQVTKKHEGQWNMQRPVELVYIKKKEKVVVDGPRDAVEAVLRALKPFTKPDDNAIMPMYDLNKMSK